MKVSVRVTIISLTLLVVRPPTAFAQTTAHPAKLSAATRHSLDSLIVAAAQKFEIPGLSVAVGSTDRKIIYIGNTGYANVSRREPATSATRFRIYSVSKVYAATVAHQLASKGLLDLNAPIGRYLADLPAWRDTVTVRQLLSHTSGIEDYTDVPGYQQAVNAGMTNEDAYVSRAVQTPLHFAPGTRWRYSNTGYYLLQRIIERVTGRPYEETLTRRILRPAKLSSILTRCSPSAEATGYTRAFAAGLKGDSLIVSPPRNNFNFALAVGGLCSTASDMVRFFQALLSARLVDSASLADMMRLNPPGVAQSGAGLFVSKDDEGLNLSHSGESRNGNSEVMAFVHDSLVLAAVANASGVELEQLLRAMRRRILGIPDPVIADLPISHDEITRLVGLYPEVNGPGRIIVGAKGDSLFAFGGRLRKQPDGSFVPDYSTDLHAVFSGDESGKAAELTLLRYGVVVGRWRRKQEGTSPR